MKYFEGDIIFLRNVVFNDKEGVRTVDTRMGGHPFVVLEDTSSENSVQLLKITTGKLQTVPQYLLLPNATKPYLKYSSYVNLNKIYVLEEERNIVPRIYLKEAEFQNLLIELDKVKKRVIFEKVCFKI